MESGEIITKIKDCIKDAHKYSEGLGKSTSIHKDQLVNYLDKISSTEIHKALLDLKEKGEIEFSSNNPDIILLTEKFK